MDSRFTPFILTELPHRHARRTKIILGALFITACVLALGLHLTGRHDVAVYDGSWTEWGGREDTPVAS